VEEIQEGIRHGVRKVNIDTDIRLAMTGAIRRSLAEHPREFDPRTYLKAAVAAARGICIARFEAFGCAGQGSKIEPIPLEPWRAAMPRANHHGAAHAPPMSGTLHRSVRDPAR